MRGNAGKSSLDGVYRILFSEFGPQGWWPAETPFEVIVGAVLTQSTSWSNVEKAIGNLKAAMLLKPDALRKVDVRKLAGLIKPSLYYNIKARKLKSFLKFFYGEFDGRMDLMRETPLDELRPKLLNVWGVGPETADSILLYALNKPAFVVDGYTRRLFTRLGLLKGNEDYEEIKKMFEAGLKKDVQLYKEYHALIVEQSKRTCLKNKPKCKECKLKKQCPSTL
jgi:endonuclease-3 related protein